ncbi:1-deoxyxylulose-5-phosphate synthase YajO-like [Mytilus californianus]|uniref:1-deoxyxylulose-5-phosphate synthase YajO-like n=1 Tax=Mytilus californianus TaxID=6549 RepID=UPI002246450A|nr:1-deoxyxylulose-5-phosphate synthase YajO-like [Mytilus californianus]
MTTTKESCGVEYTHVGKSGLKVSNVCLGTMTFGKNDDHPVAVYSCPTQADEEKSHKLLDRYVELGGNFLDTANVYCFGLSEKIIGTWLKKQKRDNIVVASKVRFPIGMEPNSVGLSRRHIIKSCEDSLERLQTDYIDLYQTHIWDDATPIEETMRTLDDLVRCGKVRYIGACNLVGWQMQKVVDLTKYMGLTPLISLQQQYNLLTRHPEFEEFQVCKNEGLGVLPWSPLKGGVLTGKYKRGEKLDHTSGRIAHIAKDESKAMQSAPAWSQYANNESYWSLIKTMEEIGKAHGKSVAQVALRWTLQKDVVASVIIGATSIKQLEDNMAVGSGWSLTKKEMEKLDQVSIPDIPYPYEMSWRCNSARVNRYNPRPFIANVY